MTVNSLVTLLPRKLSLIQNVMTFLIYIVSGSISPYDHVSAVREQTVQPT